MGNNTFVESNNKETQKKKKGSPIWKIAFILLIIGDAIFDYFLLGIRGPEYGLIKTIFLPLPIVNLLLLIGYHMRVTHGNSLGLLKAGFILLITVNVMFGYMYYQAYQARDNIGLGFLVVIPFMFVLAINDLIALLFLQHYTTYKSSS